VTFEEPEHRQAAGSELALLATGILTFIASFLPWYSNDFKGGLAETGVTGTYNAWHGLAAAGLLLVLFSLVVTAAGPLLGEDAPTRPLAIAAAALACAGAALVIARSLALPDPHIQGVTASLRWGGWVLIVVVLAHAAISVLRVVHANDA